MNHLQPEQMREMEEFKSAYGGDILKFENNNNNNNNKNGSSYRTSEVQMRRRVSDFPPHPPTPSPSSNRIISSSTTRAWNENNNNNNNNNINNNKSQRVCEIQRKSSWIDDPEVKRQRRIVKYKAYAVEANIKASLRNGLRWVKNKYVQLVHGY